MVKSLCYKYTYKYNILKYNTDSLFTFQSCWTQQLKYQRPKLSIKHYFLDETSNQHKNY